MVTASPPSDTSCTAVNAPIMIWPRTKSPVRRSVARSTGGGGPASVPSRPWTSRSHSDWPRCPPRVPITRSEEHTSELQSLMRISYAVFCLKKKKKQKQHNKTKDTQLYTTTIYNKTNTSTTKENIKHN